ncbi:hypothetical protein AA103196_1714 [Ameyamaea chiangmaiensis NBRC 103196]|uniref:Uncharacterized protein n=1 Tax=Ameyamaea chiangmaiensis TaxID=442969 RepID=A0A850P440_9PROT|nr:hypothetical protein [Ameyamaea chiangmaiensis]MBS4074019.1 hypothetical protein [Ameyamaea chiangmaiensis]NVN39425.1 hypothetical protein [Ameyamaea chiangmaiensis]GBQ67583.1 hypothetical protein AA103196_1714 [Ameyamaea chiangmaiensis NBRC 103196]
MSTQIVDRCANIGGGRSLLDGDPGLVVVRNALVDCDAVYGQDRLLVSGSAHWQGASEGGLAAIVSDAPQSTLSQPDQADRLPERRYLWLGTMPTDRARFLLTGLTRLWALLRPYPDAPRPVLVISGISADALFDVPHCAEVWRALGFTPDDFLTPTVFDRFPSLEVPGPAFIENGHAWSVWHDSMMHLADRLAAPSDESPDGRPLYIAPGDGPSEADGLGANAQISAGFHQQGFLTVDTRTVGTLAERIRLWRRHPTIVTFAGDAAVITALVRNRMLVLVHASSNVSGSQVMIDQLNGHTSLYLNVERAIRDTGAPQQAIAEGVFDAVRTVRSSPRPARPYPLAQTLFGGQPFQDCWGTRLDIAADHAAEDQACKTIRTLFDTETVVYEARIFIDNPGDTDEALHVCVLVRYDAHRWIEVMRDAITVSAATPSFPVRKLFYVPQTVTGVRVGLVDAHAARLGAVELFGETRDDGHGLTT